MRIPLYDLRKKEEVKLLIDRIKNGKVASLEGLPITMTLEVSSLDFEQQENTSKIN